MRTIEKEMCAAVMARRNWKKSNTEVVVSDGGAKVAVFLHGNKIYMESAEGWAWFSLCGWNTPTTRSRLNALGINVRQVNYEPVFNGLLIDADAIIRIR